MSEATSKRKSYIDEFKNEVDHLCNPYTHPVYLSLLPKLSNRLNNNLEAKLNSVLESRLAPYLGSGNSLSYSFRVRNNLRDKITLAFKSEKTPSKLNILKSDLLTTLEALPNGFSPGQLPQDVIQELERGFNECFEEYLKQKRELIRAVIRREPKIAEGKENSTEDREQKSEQDSSDTSAPQNTQLSLEKRCARLDEIIKALWRHLSRSLLEGEFMEDSKYSEKLQTIVQKIRETYSTYSPEEVVYLHPILPRIYVLCQELSYMCQLIWIQTEQDALENTHSRSRVFHAPVSDLINKPYAGGANSGEMLKANLFYDLGSKLVEMTKIDVSGVIDARAISCLLLLHKQCSLLFDNEELGSTDFPWDTEIEAIFLAVRAKTSLLLFQSFYKPHVDPKTKALDVAKSVVNPYHRAENFKILYEGEQYYLTEQSSGEPLLHGKIERFQDLTPTSLGQEHFGGDVEKYNKYIQRGLKGRETATKSEGERQRLLNRLLENVNEEQEAQPLCSLPLDVLLMLMKELSEMKENKNDRQASNSRYAKAMGHLLKCFSERLQSYKDFVAAEQKRDKYADSFYEVKGTSLKIFISSYGCKLLHTQALETEAYPKYNRCYRQWLSDAQEDTMKEAIELAEKAEKASREAKEASQEAKGASQKMEVANQEAKGASQKAEQATQKVEEANQRVKEANQRVKEANQRVKDATQKMKEIYEVARDSKNEIDKKISTLMIDTRKEAISLLSVFVALITFISGGITILKGVNSLADYLVLTGTLYIFVASIISFLYFKNIEGENRQEQTGRALLHLPFFFTRGGRPRNLRLSIVFAIISIIIGLSLRATQGTKEGSGSLEMNYEAGSIRQVFPSRGQTTGPLTPTDTESGNANMGEEGKREEKPENPPTSTSRKDHPLPMNHR